MDPVYFTSVILLIIVSSVITPLALKALYVRYPDNSLTQNGGETAAS